MTSDIYGHMLNLIEKMFFCEQCKKYRNFLPVRKFSTNGQFPQILEWFAQKSAETLRWRKISTLGNQKKFQHFKQWKLRLLLFTCLLFSAGLTFPMKYVWYDSLKILFTSRIAKNGTILKFPPPHVLLWLLTSICCNSGCRVCCL